MQKMLKICDKFANDFDLKFNADKSVAMRLGCRFKHICAPLILNGKALQYVSEIKYLGVTIKTGKQFDVNYDIWKCKFYCCFNSIFCKS